MRTKGSCRFEPYCKVQTWDGRAAAWVDVQKAHPTEEAARKATPRGRRARIVTVTEQGRTFGQPFDT